MMPVNPLPQGLSAPVARSPDSGDAPSDDAVAPGISMGSITASASKLYSKVIEEDVHVSECLSGKQDVTVCSWIKEYQKGMLNIVKCLRGYVQDFINFKLFLPPPYAFIIHSIYSIRIFRSILSVPFSFVTSVTSVPHTHSPSLPLSQGAHLPGTKLMPGHPPGRFPSFQVLIIIVISMFLLLLFSACHQHSLTHSIHSLLSSPLLGYNTFRHKSVSLFFHPSSLLHRTPHPLLPPLQQS